MNNKINKIILFTIYVIKKIINKYQVNLMIFSQKKKKTKKKGERKLYINHNFFFNIHTYIYYLFIYFFILSI
jgi:hypothetical protein